MVEEQSLYFRTDKKTLPKRTYKPDTLLDNLVKRRKLELEVGHPSFAKNQHVETSAQACQKQVDANVTKALPKMEERTIKSSGITFSVSRAVAGFINLNSRDAALIRDKDILNTTSEKDEKPRIVEETLYEDDSYGSFNFSAPRQNVSKNSSQGCFILSSTAYKQRQLIRQIRERLPRARLIERDFNSSLAISRQHNKKTNSNFASEADVLISPRTGLVLTTLQRLKQRALPGQRITVSPVKERLKALSGKYEQLILLIGKTGISDAEVDNFSQLDESDCKALANMQGFGMQLECELIINFALGGKAELIEWTIAVMHKYSVSNNISNNLLEDESPVSVHSIPMLRMQHDFADFEI